MGSSIFGPGGSPEDTTISRGGVGGPRWNTPPTYARNAAGQMVRTGGLGAPTPGVGVSGGGGQAPTTGGGGSGSDWSIAQNPMFTDLMKRYDQLWGESQDLSKQGYNPDPAMQEYQRTRGQGMKQAMANAGQRGLNAGMGLSALQDYTQGTEQGAQKIAADQYNKGLDFQKELLGQMGGMLTGQGNAAGQSAQSQLGLMNLGIESQKANQDYAIKMQQLPLQLQQAQLSALSQLMGLI